MNKMYGLFVGQYSDRRILAVTHDKKLAERWMEAMENEKDEWDYNPYDDIRICEVQVIPNRDPYKEVSWEVSLELTNANRNSYVPEDIQVFQRSGWAIDMWPPKPEDIRVRWVKAPCHKINGKFIACRLEVVGPTQEGVLKVATEQLMLWKAGGKISFCIGSRS